MRSTKKMVCLLIILCISILSLTSCSSNNANSKATITEIPQREAIAKATTTPTEKPTAVPTATPKKSTTSSSSKSNYSSSRTSFTNKYGTSTTKCAHPGCNNYIASSGDTNCCTTHSRRCGECGKYIDEDAMFCMDCIRKALGN